MIIPIAITTKLVFPDWHGLSGEIFSVRQIIAII